MLAQSSNGVESVRRVAEFVEKLVRAKQAYAAACLAAVVEVNRPLVGVPVQGGIGGGGGLQAPVVRGRAGSVGGGGGAGGGKPRSGSSAVW